MIPQPKPNSKKIDRTAGFAAFIDTFITKEDFLKGYRDMVKRVKAFEDTLARDFKDLWATVDKKIEDKLTTLRHGEDGKDGRPGKDGKDGYTPIKDIDYFDGEHGQDGKDGSPDTAEQIRDKLAVLEGDERLSIGHIHGLVEALQEGRKIADRTAIGISRPNLQYIDLSSQLNGSSVTFNTQSFQRVVQISLSSFPNILRPNIDFSTAQQPPSITFLGTIAANAATILASDQTCIVLVMA